MHLLIVYNPNAGRRRGRHHADKLEKACRSRALSSVNLTVTKFSSSSLEIMRAFWQDNTGNPNGYDVIVIIGGDGTVGPIIDAIIKNSGGVIPEINETLGEKISQGGSGGERPRNLIEIPIYCYGRGTANDFASYFRTNCRAKSAAKFILAGKTQIVDTLLTSKSYGVNVACGGAFTNGVTNYNKKSKKLLGKFAYLIHAFFKAFTMKAQSMDFTVDDTQFSEDVFLFYVLNTKNVGGLKNSGPLADPSDRLLDLVVLKKCGLFGKMSLKINQSLKRLHKCKHVKYIQGTQFHISPTPGHEITPNFTLTDIDGNASEPYPLEVTLGPKIKIITR